MADVIALEVEVGTGNSVKDLDTLKSKIASLKEQATKAFETGNFKGFAELTKQAVEAESKFKSLGGVLVSLPGSVKELQQEVTRLTANIVSAAAAGDKIAFEKATKELEAFEAEVKNTDQGLALLGEAADASAGKGTNAFRDLKKEVQDLTSKAILAEKAGDHILSEKFFAQAGKAKDELVDINKKVAALDPSAKAEAFSRLGETIVAGFTAGQGAAALFGGASEDVVRSIEKLEASIAILNAVQSVSNTLKQADIVKTVALTTVQSAYSLAVGASSGALRIFRLALIGTGIGALIVGLGLLVANFDKIKAAITGNTEGFQKFKQILTFILPPIGLLVQAVDALIRNFDKVEQVVSGSLAALGSFATSAGKVLVGLLTFDPAKVIDGFSNAGKAAGQAFNDGVASKAKEQSDEKLIESLKVQQKQYEVLQKEVETRYDKEIALAQAAGKETYAIEQKKFEAVKNTLSGQINALEQRLIISKQYNAEELADLDKLLLERGDKLTDAQKQEIEGLKKLRDDREKITTESEVATIKANTDRAAKAKELNDKLVDYEKNLSAELKSIRENVSDKALPADQREVIQLQRKYADLIEKTKEGNAKLVQEAKGNEAVITKLKQDEANALEQIEAAHQADLKQLQAQQFTDRSNTEYTDSLKDLDAFNEAEKTKLIQQLADKYITQEQYDAQTVTLTQTVADTRVKIATDYAGNVKAAEADVVTFTQAAETAKAQATIDQEKRKQADLQTLRDESNAKAVDDTNPASFEEKSAVIQANFESELVQAAGNEQRLFEVKKKYTELQKQLDKERSASAKATAKAAIDVGVAAVNAITSLYHAQSLISTKGITDDKKLADIRKKNLDIQKKNARNQLLVDQARAIASGVASAAATPFPGNIPAIIASIATILGNFATAKKALSDAGEAIGGDSLGGSIASEAGGAITNAASTYATQTQPTTVLARTTAQAGTQPPTNQQQNQTAPPTQDFNVNITAQVVETEMTSKQGRVALIQNRAQFG